MIVLAVIGVRRSQHRQEDDVFVRATMTARARGACLEGRPAKAGGVYTATVTENGAKRSIEWKLTFHNLSGPAARSAHPHGQAGCAAGGVLLALCGPCKSGMTGHASTSTDVGDAIENGKAYVNVHTAKNGGGEIRGAVKLIGHS